ncbi:glycosyltransferase [Persicimonas caeni]|uniref:Glycosyltransferase n=1 Tax=Persicimonas caeni TaxID=2292766 RepID=A0A4Y6PTN1_PERCE|nr:glycosyltransferase [Persicimonas caeni]QDG51682.1 glycosyltransferase [Persicimonas caeni]QED32903.1 glycosyltransferase [Persicimonas caeni]
MKILVVGKFYVEGFARHIGQTLEQMGHEVLRFEPGVERKPTGGFLRRKLESVTTRMHAAAEHIDVYRKWSLRELTELARRARPDLIISCYDFLRPAEVASLKKLADARVVMWYPDALVNFGRSHFMVAPYDAIFFKDPYIVEKLDGVIDSPVFYLPECFNPLVHRADASESEGPLRNKYHCDITTAGNMYAYRVAFFRHLTDYNVKLWGNPLPSWIDAPEVRAMHQGEYVVEADKAEAFLGAKIVLDNMHPAEVWGINCRAFEVAGIGGFLMLDSKPGLHQLFTDGEEVVSFRSVDDLRAKIDYYLERPDERRRIAQAGRRRAHAEHTYEARLRLLFATLEGQRDGFERPEIACQRVHAAQGA